MFTFNPKARNPAASMKSVDTGFADGWYTSTDERPNAAVVANMTTAQAYAWVSEIYGVVGKIKSAIRAYPWELRRGNEVVTDAPEYASFAPMLRANFAYAAGCALLDGAAFWLPTSERVDGKDVYFDPLPIGTVKIENENNGKIKKFVYTYGGRSTDYAPDAMIYFGI